jgi:hypothetical protein
LTFHKKEGNILEVNKTVERGSARFSPDLKSQIGQELQDSY